MQGTQPQNMLKDALKKYESSNYKEAAPIFVEYLNKHERQNAQALAYLGFCVYKIQRNAGAKKAIELLQEAIKLKPNEAEYYELLGLVVRDGAYAGDQAIQLFERAYQLDNERHSAIHALGVTYYLLGEVEKAMDLIIFAMQKKPVLTYLEDAFHFSYYDPRFKNADYLRFGKLYRLEYKDQFKPKAIQYDPSRYNPNKEKLVLGFFNCEPLDTPTWDFAEKIIKELDPNKFVVNCYANPQDQKVKRSSVENLKAISNKWAFTNHLTIEETAKYIHDDGVDILIDQSGFLASGHRTNDDEQKIAVFVHKAAPVQLTWYGYWGTTGLEEMDYLITSEGVVPPEEEVNFAEKIYSLPNAYTHASIYENLPDCKEPPCIKNGYITFGYLNRRSKLNSEIFDLWAEILKQVENSKLYIKYHMNPFKYIAETIYQPFEERGISRDRIILENVIHRESIETFMGTYDRIDITFDTFPFTGITTALNSLTMGVPVISKLGDRVVSRATALMLQRLGLDEMVANSNEEYIKLAVSLAKDPEKLKAYRKTLRTKVYESPMNIKQFAKDFEDAMFYIWKDCCSGKH